jgi:hypothetical protein
VAVKVEVEDVSMCPSRFKKTHGTTSGKKVMPTSSVEVKKKSMHSSSVVGPSSSPAVRSAVVKLMEARRKAMEKEKAPIVMLEVDISSASLCIYMPMFVLKFV